MSCASCEVYLVADTPVGDKPVAVQYMFYDMFGGELALTKRLRSCV